MAKALRSIHSLNTATMIRLISCDSIHNWNPLTTLACLYTTFGLCTDPVNTPQAIIDAPQPEGWYCVRRMATSNGDGTRADRTEEDSASIAQALVC